MHQSQPPIYHCADYDAQTCLQDMLHALLLSEGVYLGVDVGEAAAAEAISKLQAEMLPSHLTRLHAVQWSKPHANQR